MSGILKPPGPPPKPSNATQILDFVNQFKAAVMLLQRGIFDLQIQINSLKQELDELKKELKNDD